MSLVDSLFWWIGFAVSASAGLFVVFLLLWLACAVAQGINEAMLKWCKFPENAYYYAVMKRYVRRKYAGKTKQ